MANFLAVPVPTMGRRRHRAVSENVLGTELYKEREEENVLRSSWEVAKTHFGHVKVTPAPSRVKIDDDRPRERVFYVLARPSKSLLTRRPMLELHDNSPLRECDEEESEERAPKKKRKKRNRKKRKHTPETTHPTLSMMSNIKSAAKNPTKKVDEAPKKVQEDSREHQQPTVRSDLSLETLSGSQNASTSMSGDGQPEKDRYSVRKGTIEHDLVAWVTVDQIGLVRQLKGVAPPVAEMTGPTTSKMQTFRISKTENSQLDQQSQTYATIEDYIRDTVLDLEKARPIKKILVATNGIAAVKCLVSIRKRMMNLFKNDRIIKMVCMTTDQEIDSQAEYLKYADHIAIAPAGANTNNYANVDEIISQAVLNNVDAVWAGWGHASENPRLPEELAKHNIVFIGPPADAMFALGDKIASTIIAQTVQIPTIEWSGSGLVVNDPEDAPQGATVNIPSELYKQACVYNVEEGLKCLREKNITYPIMIKASEGGGGKGIRKCNNDEEFRINFRRVQTEVPGSPIFLMKCLMNARHIEVQLIADQYGQVVPFFTRDCSIQRRCQKIIEEAPAGIAPKEVLRQMQQDAVNLAKKVGYVSAGTVEYMYLPETKKYYFLELNPRLQVEHPCTEMISNINIPAIQLQVAMGLPLHRIDEIRLFFGMDRYGKSALPDDQIRTDVNICVIAARITSEDPSDQFKPASGTVMNLQFQSNQNVWGYFSVSATGKVHEYADSQFGHLFAKGSTRHEAIAAMTCALKELRVRSTFPSQINYLVDLLNDEEFQRNDFHTGWLDTRIQNNIQSVPELPVNVTLAVGATVIGHAKIAEVFSKFQSAIERGQILPTSELTETFELELVHNNVKYSVLVNRYGPINFLVKLNNSEICTEVRELGHESLLVTYSDQSYTCHLEEEIERYKVNIGRSLTIFEKENDPSVLRSRNAGRLLQYLVKDGEMVEKGETYAEMESMKMVINLEVKKAGGRLVHVARPGQALFPGTLIARLDDQGDMTSARPEEFEDDFDEWNQAEERKQLGKVRLNVKFEQLMQACKDVLDGYAVPESLFEQRKKALVDELFAILEDQSLPYTLFKVMLNVVETRINKIGTYNKIKELIAKENIEFPAQELAEEMESYMATLEPSAAAVDQQYFDPLLNICDKFRSGLKGHKRLVVEELLNAYHQTETHFQEVSYDKGVNNIKSIESNPQAVVRKVYSHTRIRAKNELLKEIIRRLDNAMIMDLQKPLKKAANLFNKENEPLALFIRETLNKIHQNRDYGQIYAAVSRRSSEKSLQDLINKPNKDSVKILDEFMTKASENQLVLHEFFFTSNKQTNSYAIRMFIRNTFYINDKDIKEIPIDIKQNTAVFKFELSEDTPLFEHHHATNKRAVYFLSVLPELDLLKSEQLLNILKKNVEPQAQNTFLFVALPTGQNGYAQFAKYAEKELRRRAKELRNEVAERLRSHGSVDLMISRAGSPPLYTHYDFSSNEKLEIFRLPEEIVDISVENSPYLLFKHNVGRISRIFVRYLLRDVKAVVKPEKYSNQRWDF
uniref:biotin carboxylase n=1 Tax=Bursaphelenchus xylophilus TaxID=6326 RepID=A0A1I7RZR9_BURXY